MRHSKKLIEKLINAAQERGHTANALAARAGIAPSNLSRIRKHGKFNADSLERLLAAADVDILVCPRPQAKTALVQVLQKLNASRQHQIDDVTFRKLLTKFRPSITAERAFSHLIGLIEETPLEQIHGLIREGDATIPALRRIASYVEGEGAVVDWLNDQAYCNRPPTNCGAKWKQ